MNKKSLFGILGCGLLIGATIYWVIKSVNKDSINNYNEELLNEKNSMDTTPEHIKDDNAVDLDEIEMQSANSMYARHKAAAQVVKESMEKINENADLPSQYEKEFDRMFEELDMLSEER